MSFVLDASNQPIQVYGNGVDAVNTKQIDIHPHILKLLTPYKINSSSSFVAVSDVLRTASMICKVILPTKSASGSFCTYGGHAFLMTNHHVIEDHAESMEARFHFPGIKTPYYLPRKLVPTLVQDVQLDYTIIILDLEHARTSRFFANMTPIELKKHPANSNTPVTLYGYPKGSTILLQSTNQIIKDLHIDPHFVPYDCASAHGSSGGLACQTTTEDGHYVAVGLHVEGQLTTTSGKKYNRAVSIAAILDRAFPDSASYDALLDLTELQNLAIKEKAQSSSSNVFDAETITMILGGATVALIARQIAQGHASSNSAALTAVLASGCLLFFLKSQEQTQ